MPNDFQVEQSSKLRTDETFAVALKLKNYETTIIDSHESVQTSKIISRVEIASI